LNIYVTGEEPWHHHENIVLGDGVFLEVVHNLHGAALHQDTLNVAFKTADQISQINLKEGDYVREGQLIASLDDADYKLGVEALQIQHDQVSDEVSRVRELYKKNIL